MVHAIYRCGYTWMPIFILFLFPFDSWAGWIAFRNDTAQVLTVQEVQLITPQKNLGKPQTLKPGDMVIDTLPCLGSRRFTILDATAKLLYDGPVPCAGNQEQLIYSVKILPNGKLVVEPARGITARGKK